MFFPAEEREPRYIGATKGHSPILMHCGACEYEGWSSTRSATILVHSISLTHRWLLGSACLAHPGGHLCVLHVPDLLDTASSTRPCVACCASRTASSPWTLKPLMIALSGSEFSGCHLRGRQAYRCLQPGLLSSTCCQKTASISCKSCRGSRSMLR